MYCPHCDAPRPNDIMRCSICGGELAPLSARKKGRLWPPAVLLAVMLLVGVYVFVITRTPSSQTPWFTVEDGVLFFDQSQYTGGTELEIPATVNGQTVTAIGAQAFQDCDFIEELTLPDTLRTIQYDAFRNCDGLRGVKLPESLTVIEDRAFYGCDELEAIYVPENTHTVQQDAFSGCPRLIHIFYTGTTADWEALYPQTITNHTLIYTVSGPDAERYQIP